jgi:GMP synthase (glutamine-hydrolysing)
MSNLCVLVVDAYPREGRERLEGCGGTAGGELYRRMLAGIARDVGLELTLEIVHPADAEAPARALGEYHGAAWTGSNLSILDRNDPRVSRQIDLARDLMAAGVASFGSCFAVQIAATALGGHCQASPNGREFGISRTIELSPEGREHPLFAHKPRVFDAFTSHADEVAVLPQGSELLASNGWSRVQAASIDGEASSFWAVQYHPEYDLHEVASLCRLRRKELVAQGSFASETAADTFIDELEALHADPTNSDLAASLAVEDTLLDERTRTREVRNWIEHLLPRRVDPR